MQEGAVFYAPQKAASLDKSAEKVKNRKKEALIQLFFCASFLNF